SEVRVPDAGAPSDAVLAAVHARTAGERPGHVSRRRRVVGVGAVGAVGVGVLAAGALVLPGLGADGAPEGGTGPVAAPSPSVEVRDGVVGVDPDELGTVQAVSYVDRARTAVEEVDLATLVLEVESSFGVQHPGDAALDTSVSRDITAGDGSATRWVQEEDSASSAGAGLAGVEEVNHADPARPEGEPTHRRA